MPNPTANDDTEFADALRARGILPPKPPSRSPSPDIPHITHHDAISAIAATADHVQLSTLLENEQLDSDDEAIFESYKQKRMEQMRQEEKRGRFGSMEPLARENFVREVTEGSQQALPGDEVDTQVKEDSADEEENAAAAASSSSRRLKGTGVVVFLFKDSVPLSQHLRPLLASLARYHPSTKFLSIPAGLCIPNYPDKNVPTLLVYRNGDMVGNVVAGAGLPGMRTTIRDLEGLLLRYRALEKPSAELRAAGRRDDDDEDSGDDMDEGIGAVNAKSSGIRTGGTGHGVGRGARRTAESDDSDFDM